MYNKESIPKAAITGIDGVGKSTTTWYALESLSRVHGLTIVKPNPPAEYITPKGRTNEFVEIYGLVDKLHSAFDQKRNRNLVLCLNALRIAIQGRIVEPRLIAKYRPDVVITTRDVITDSAVYQIFYVPRPLLRTIPDRLNRAKLVSGSSYRDLIVLLTADPQEAVRRIDVRVEEEKKKAPVTNRKHWMHLHENREALEQLQNEYHQVLYEVRRRHPTRVAEVNTNVYSREEASAIIKKEVFDLVLGKTQRQWVRYPQFDTN